MTPETLTHWQTYLEARIKLNPDPRLYEELGRTVMMLEVDNE